MYRLVIEFESFEELKRKLRKLLEELESIRVEGVPERGRDIHPIR